MDKYDMYKYTYIYIHIIYIISRIYVYIYVHDLYNIPGDSIYDLLIPLEVT